MAKRLRKKYIRALGFVITGLGLTLLILNSKDEDLKSSLYKAKNFKVEKWRWKRQTVPPFRSYLVFSVWGEDFEFFVPPEVMGATHLEKFQEYFQFNELMHFSVPRDFLKSIRMRKRDSSTVVSSLVPVWASSYEDSSGRRHWVLKLPEALQEASLQRLFWRKIAWSLLGLGAFLFSLPALLFTIRKTRRV